MADYQLRQPGATIQDAIDIALGIEAQISAETAAREAADALLASKTELQNEVARAQAAEALLATIVSLNNEIARATGVEDSLQSLIDAINEKIPSAASASNQLADKAFVNSSIATATATFRGTYNSLAELQAVSADENDYGYVRTTDAAGNTIFKRYKYASGSWVFEYDLNNSSFTASQWAAINSAITAELVEKLRALPTNAALTELLNGKQGVIPDLDTIRANAAAGGTAYQKPAGGIPKSDMSADVQTSLRKADSAVQESAIADNLTTDDAKKVLSAKQGVVLAGQISQLGQDVNELANGGAEAKTALSSGFNGCALINSGTQVLIHPGANGNNNLVFFAVEAGNTYRIYVEKARNNRAWGWCDSYFSVAPSVDTNLGGLVSTDTVANNTPFEKVVTNSNYPYIVIAYTRGTTLPTLEKLVDSKAVLYTTQRHTEADKAIARENIGAASVDQLNNLAGEIDSTTAEVVQINKVLEYELGNEDIEETPTSVQDILPLNATYQGKNSMVTDYIFVKANTHIRITGVAKYAGFSLEAPASGVNLEWYNLFPTTSSANAYDYIFEQDGYLGLARSESAETTEFVLVNNGVKKTVDSLVDSTLTDADIQFPSFVYGVYNMGDLYRKVSQKIHFEGVTRGRDENLSLNYGKEINLVKIGAPSANVATEIRNIKLTKFGNAVKEGQFSFVTTKNSVIGSQFIKHLAIGDSWAAQDNLSMDGESIGPWNYAAVVMEEFLRAQIDLEDTTAHMIQLGRKSSWRRNGQYKGQEYYIRSSAEGQGGWSACSYLRFPFSIRTEGTGTMSEKLAWDALGLGRKQVYGETYDETAPYTDYVPGAADRVKYLTEVAMGYYHWDYSTELLNYAGVTGSYTGTVEQKAAIDAKMEDVLNNPDNPFYDWATARSTNGAYAFSLAKYLERYKTLEDDGVTRLVVGSTAGTEITSDYINRYDICKPTHVTIELGMNDYRGLTIQQRLADIVALCDAIHSYDSDIYVGIVTVHALGSFYPELFTGEIATERMPDTEIAYEAPLFDLNKAVMAAYPSEAGTSKVYYIPSFIVQGFTRSGAKNGLTSDGRKIIIDGSDYIHPAMNVCYDMGQQIWAWILYTLS